MEMITKAIAKAVSVNGANILCKKDVLHTLLEDMVPEQTVNRQLIQMVYNDEIGHILSKAAQASYSDKEKYYQELDMYLKNNNGLHEQKREEFISIFRTAFRRETVDVKKYKDYKPALCALKKKFGPIVSNDVIQSFIEENKLFYRFSLTVDDVIEDLKDV